MGMCLEFFGNFVGNEVRVAGVQSVHKIDPGVERPLIAGPAGGAGGIAQDQDQLVVIVARHLERDRVAICGVFHSGRHSIECIINPCSSWNDNSSNVEINRRTSDTVDVDSPSAPSSRSTRGATSPAV